MGKPKQLLPLAGRPLLTHAVAAAAASILSEVLVVLGHEADTVARALAPFDGGRVRAVVCSDYRAGQSASLRAGLRAADGRAVAAAILLGDQPFVAAGLIDRMIHELAACGRPAARPLYVTAEGVRIPGHPVVIARSLWETIALGGGDAGARSLFAARPGSLHEVELEGPAPADIDEPADYERLVTLRGT